MCVCVCVCMCAQVDTCHVVGGMKAEVPVKAVLLIEIHVNAAYMYVHGRR